MAEYPRQTEGWDVVFDARGHFHEPHTELIVPLGTLNVRKYLKEIAQHTVGPITIDDIDEDYPTKGPAHRFSAILFIEKEGFLPLFREVKLAERFDIAIMSTKGVSSTAARMLVERICAPYGIPLLVLHDFDKSGFTIVGTLCRDTRRYSFTRGFKLVDLGLRLADIQKWELESEDVDYGKSDPTRNLKENGATAGEMEFLCPGGGQGQRVELNAFASGDLVEWIEGKLQENGIKKVVPDEDTLATAYRRAMEIELLKERTADIVQSTHEEVKDISIPKNLEKKVRRLLKEDPKLSWDEVVAEIACDREDL
jgi:hypothetical protein